MFERFTEKARRVIFFARYEASQYGSRHIETEHMLLGLVREDRALILQVAAPDTDLQTIRVEIEKSMIPRERITTSVEVPLTAESKKILTGASEEASRLGHHHVGTEHILLALLQDKDSLPKRILARVGVTREGVHQLMKGSARHNEPARPLPTAQPQGIVRPVSALSLKQAEDLVTEFLANFKARQWTDAVSCLADHVRFIDASGNRWAGHGEVHAQFERLFSPYANQGASFEVESTNRGPGGCVIANVLWKGLENPGEASGSMQRMTVMLGEDHGKWQVFFIQVTPIHGFG